MNISRAWAMPDSNTFSIPPIKEFISQNMDCGLWIDPFANTSRLAQVTNDLNTEFNTDYHLDAYDFLKMFDDCSVDGILFDPPYSPRQISECYKSIGIPVTGLDTSEHYYARLRPEISRIVKPHGKVLSFGWNSNGIGMKYGFEIESVLLVAHGGHHNDTICVCEVKGPDQGRLF